MQAKPPHMLLNRIFFHENFSVLSSLRCRRTIILICHRNQLGDGGLYLQLNTLICQCTKTVLVIFKGKCLQEKLLVKSTHAKHIRWALVAPTNISFLFLGLRLRQKLKFNRRHQLTARASCRFVCVQQPYWLGVRANNVVTSTQNPFFPQPTLIEHLRSREGVTMLQIVITFSLQTWAKVIGPLDLRI